jgi:hypothetical protein
MPSGVVRVTLFSKTIQGVHAVIFEVNHLKYRLEKEAGEHTSRDYYPFSFVLGSKQLANIELSIEGAPNQFRQNGEIL